MAPSKIILHLGMKGGMIGVSSRDYAKELDEKERKASPSGRYKLWYILESPKSRHSGLQRTWTNTATVHHAKTAEAALVKHGLTNVVSVNTNLAYGYTDGVIYKAVRVHNSVEDIVEGRGRYAYCDKCKKKTHYSVGLCVKCTEREEEYQASIKADVKTLDNWMNTNPWNPRERDHTGD